MNDCQLISIIKQFLQATETLNLSRNITNDVNASRGELQCAIIYSGDNLASCYLVTYTTLLGEMFSIQ